MNTLGTYSVSSPFGKTDKCARFVIDDIENPFLMTNIATVGQQYTLSFWVCSESEGDLTVCGSSFHTTVDWLKYTTTFVAESESISWLFTSIGTYHIYHPQLETGTIATDWKPASEDLSDAIDAVSTELSVKAGEIDLKFESTNDRVEGLENKSKHFTLTDNGLLISSGENNMSIRIDNDIIVFEKNGVQFGWWDGIDFHTGNIQIEVTERAQFGNYAFVPRSDGSLSFLKVSQKEGFYATLANGLMLIYGAYPTLDGDTLVIGDDISAELSETTLILGGQQ